MPEIKKSRNLEPSEGSSSSDILDLSLEAERESGRMDGLLEASCIVSGKVIEISSFVTDPSEKLKVLHALNQLTLEVQTGKKC